MTCPPALRRRRLPLRGALLLATLLAWGCGDDVTVTGPEPATVPDPARGRVAFRAACAGCHASGDGFDLALFGFTDTTIVRRAVVHVDTATALDIVAHVRSLPARPLDRSLRVFQPGGAPLASDAELALALFGGDVWPEYLGETELRAIDPSAVPTAVPFPVWSDEESNLDWMPDEPLPTPLLDAQGGLARGALAGYSQAPTDENLVSALAALRRATHEASTPVAPCAEAGDGTLPDPALCFQVTRWTATLAAQHILRAGAVFDGDLVGSTAAQDAFWDVGQAAYQGLVANGDPVENVVENWISWMYLGWVFAPRNHVSVYASSGLATAGLPRHATFVALRSLVERPARSGEPYRDLQVAAAVAPDHWVAAVFESGLSVLEAREARGELPGDGPALDVARQALLRLETLVAGRLEPARAEAVLARIRGLKVEG